MEIPGIPDLVGVDRHRGIHDLVEPPGIIEVAVEVRQGVGFTFLQVAEEFLFDLADDRLKPVREGVFDVDGALHGGWLWSYDSIGSSSCGSCALTRASWTRCA